MEIPSSSPHAQEFFLLVLQGFGGVLEAFCMFWDVFGRLGGVRKRLLVFNLSNLHYIV